MVADDVSVTILALVGDGQGDRSLHGVSEKAVYGYAARHHPALRSKLPAHAHLFVAGGMGENLAITGLDEGDLRIGDVHRAGSAILQVSQPRQPCFNLAACFDDAKMPRDGQDRSFRW